jgi:hypothetical protein
MSLSNVYILLAVKSSAPVSIWPGWKEIKGFCDEESDQSRGVAEDYLDR